MKVKNNLSHNKNNKNINNLLANTSNLDKQVIEKGKRLSQGCTSLMYACQQGNTEDVVNELRTKPQKVRHRDRSNKNALHYCSGKRDNLVAAASVAVAAPELLGSADEDGFTPLHLAVIQGNLAMVNLLLANNADVNVVDNEGHSVVHWATVCGEVDALRAVMQAGANVQITDINGGSPLHYAAQMCGANYERKITQASSKLAMEILEILLAHPQSSVDVTDKDGRQPLLWAASAGSAKAVIALIKAGAKVESADKDGLTALHCAASRGHTECIDTLIGLCGVYVDLIDSNGCTALHYAVTLGHADATARLLDLEADPNRQDRKGRTPAHCGCAKGQLETVKLLKERGANLWLRNAKGDLPIHEAAASGRRELVEWLLDQRPKQVNTASNDNRTMLHIAASCDYTDMCKLLIDYGADVNSIFRNSKGVTMTPLDCALQKGLRSTAKFLQSAGGLPANKLRLSSRPNAFSQQSFVQPLKYIEKEELHDLNSKKKYLTYTSKRSDSDSTECSCTEHLFRKEHRINHVCKHHRKKFRRRTSSCGEQICCIKHIDEGRRSVAAKKTPSGYNEAYVDMSRSKSNIEIREMHPKDCYFYSTEDNEAADDSCEVCCKHKRRVKLKKKDKHSKKQSRESLMPSKNDSPDVLPPERLQDEKEINARPNNDEINFNKAGDAATEEAHFETQNEIFSRPSSTSNRKQRPQSAKRRQQMKEATFIKTPPSENTNKILLSQSTALDLTDDDELPKSEVVIAEVQVHKELESGTQPKIYKEKIDNKTVTEEITKEVNKVLESAAEKVENLVAVPITNVISPTPSGSEASFSVTAVNEDKQTQSDDELNKIKNDSVKQTVLETDVGLSDPNIKLDHAEIEQKKVNLDKTSVEPGKPEISQDNTEKKPMEEHYDTDSHTIQKNGNVSEITETKVEEKRTPDAPKKLEPEKYSNEKKDSLSEHIEQTKSERENESRRSFTLLPDSPPAFDVCDNAERKSSFTVLKSDESVEIDDGIQHLNQVEIDPSFQVVEEKSNEYSSDAEEIGNDDDEELKSPTCTAISGSIYKHTGRHSALAGSASEYNNGRRKRFKRRVKSGGKSRSQWRSKDEEISQQQGSKDQDSGFEPSPRAMKTKIPSPNRNIYTAYVPRKTIYATLDGRSCSSRADGRKPGDKNSCNMTAVTRSIHRNIRRYYMEKKIFQHLLELKSLQIRSNKVNESVLVKRAVDDYHKSCLALGAETGGTLRRYPYTEYTFKNFEMFLYETLKSLQKPGTYNFQNINEVYEEAERRLSPDYNTYEKALRCTTKTHRCLHAAHAYTGIPCAAYIPMMNHHTMPKYGFGPYKKTGSFYLPKIISSPTKGRAGIHTPGSTKVSLELSHGKNKQLITLPSDKLDSNKRYYVTFTVKGSGEGTVRTSTGNVGDETTTTTRIELLDGKTTDLSTDNTERK